jgi:hypothetical protein
MYIRCKAEQYLVEVYSVTARPHDIPDLYMSAVALAVDARLADLSKLSVAELRMAVAAASDSGDWTRELRSTALLATVGHLVDRHGWNLDWDPRGIRLTHGEHTFVLGIPQVFEEYLELPGEVPS